MRKDQRTVTRPRPGATKGERDVKKLNSLRSENVEKEQDTEKNIEDAIMLTPNAARVPNQRSDYPHVLFETKRKEEVSIVDQQKHR